MKKNIIEKGRISNSITFLLLILGIIFSPDLVYADWLLSAGLFGFAGGFTNWLAVKMLFDRVPFLYGSAVIPNRFREIRQAVKDAIMHYFFDQEHLEHFFDSQLNTKLTSPDMASKVRDLLQSETVECIVDSEIDDLMKGPQGLMLKMVGPKVIKPIVMQFISGVGEKAAPLLVSEFGNSVVDIDSLRDKIDELLTEQLNQLTPERVKEMMEQVIRQHLGWLVVWGNVFGSIIGVLSKALGL
tara:strand:+ start:1050 stop:1775 length:726 start_codon:yes stop_codon:yes gene_type:complete